MQLGRARIGIIALALALFLAACGGSASPTATTSDAAATETAALVGEFPTVSGDGIDLNSLEGQDVVLWFWAPW